MTDILTAEDLHFTFPGGVSALKGLSLSIRRGRTLAILGPNGSGKSTLLLHLNGTLRPHQGKLLRDGKPVEYSRRGLQALRERVALVMQDPEDQLFAATVFEDVSFGPMNLGVKEAEVNQRVEAALQALSITDLADRPTHYLSGGQMKRVAIAGAVAMRPDVLILDEPNAGLDEAAETQLLALLQALTTSGMTLCLSTHDVDLAWSLADDVALFRAGRAVRQGPARTILSDSDALAEVGLSRPIVLEAALRAREIGLVPQDTPLPRNREQLHHEMSTWSAALGSRG
ncbi:energy-coupling factor ABC transporter ATP-binding protein [Pararhodobacter sp. CCB-MM2]|uniref:energy-coupling factor ABC transporter ATP-binding protein n=1 Tax=Pararhodobacter sp. CCB-MM2 TaxID=1786003 RepID=UPI000832C400|nr:ATP-binding cassette domain-containing protein [Pararhodobacter sp. CCB-MM2]